MGMYSPVGPPGTPRTFSSQVTEMDQLSNGPFLLQGSLVLFTVLFLVSSLGLLKAEATTGKFCRLRWIRSGLCEVATLCTSIIKGSFPYRGPLCRFYTFR